MGIYDDYAALVAQHRPLYGELTLVMMEVGSFLEWYNCDENRGADVRRVCDLLNVQATRKDKSVLQVSRRNPMLGGIPRHALSKYLPVLLEADYTVVLATQVSTDPITRRVTEIISRTTGGAFVRGGGGEATNNLMAVYIEALPVPHKHDCRMIVAGWATVDIATGRTAAGECGASTVEDPRLPWDELHRAALVAEPREVVIASNDITEAEVCTCLGVPASKTRRFTVAQVSKVSYQDAVLRKVFPNTGMLTPAEFLDLERKPHALVALVAALQFAYEHNETIVTRVMRPSTDHDGSGGIMSYNSLQQLDVVSHTSSSSGASTSTSLLSVLNCCKTAPGRRAFRRRLLDPVMCSDILVTRYDAIDAAIDRDRHEAARSCLKDVCDIERAFRRIALGTLPPCDVPSLLVSLDSVSAALEVTDGSDKAAAIQNISVVARSTLDMEACSRCLLDNIRESVFLAGAHPDIDVMQTELNEARGVFYNTARRINAIAGAEHVRIEENDVDGMVLTITAKRWRALEDRCPGFTLCPASLRLLHPDIDVPRARHVAELRTRLAAAVKERYVRFLKDDLFNARDMAAAVSALEEVDVTCACARNAICMRHVRPLITTAAACDTEDDGGSFLRASGLRHALAEHLDPSVTYVPNDVIIGVPPSGLGMLLYGVNAAGKSTIMKAVGVCVLMAQAGMFVACDSCELRPFRHVLTRIGLRDDMSRGHSTFVVEMLELRNILRRAGPDALVIGDELCAGTEAASALSIVGAGVHRLAAEGGRFVFATHLHELVDLPHIRNLLDAGRVQALHVSVRCDPCSGKLIFDRKLLPGRGMPTYGLEVCRSLDMDPEFLKVADTIRRHVLGVPAHIVCPRQSRYNASVYVDVCGACGKPADHTHHVSYQSDADSHGYIGHFHKNAIHNLVPLCEACHESVHRGKLVISGYCMTSHGRQLTLEQAMQGVRQLQRPMGMPMELPMELPMGMP